MGGLGGIGFTGLGGMKPPMTGAGTFTATQAVKPMPDAVKNNINLGWDSYTGQVIQPLSAQQKAQVAIPGYSPNIKIPTQSVFPNLKSSTGQFVPTAVQAPVKPQVSMIGKPQTSASQSKFNQGYRW